MKNSCDQFYFNFETTFREIYHRLKQLSVEGTIDWRCRKLKLQSSENARRKLQSIEVAVDWNFYLFLLFYFAFIFILHLQFYFIFLFYFHIYFHGMREPIIFHFKSSYHWFKSPLAENTIDWDFHQMKLSSIEIAINCKFYQFKFFAIEIYKKKT